MTGLWTALALLAVAGLGSAAAPRLADARWPMRAPGLGILAWQSLSLSLVSSLTLASIALVIPQLPAKSSLAELMHLCTTVLTEQLRRPETGVLTVLGLAGVVGLTTRFGFLLVRGRLTARRRRRRQHASLLLTGTHRVDGLIVIEHHTPVVYCLPGRRSRIIATTGATESLTAVELDGVMAHERAHLRLRHDLALAVAQALARTFRGVRTFEFAASQVARLVEMQADDAAGMTARPHLARAMLHLAQGPSGALSAGGATVDRARRLLTPMAPLPPAHRLLIAGTALAAIVAPVALGLLPSASTIGQQCCLTTSDTSHRWDLEGRH